MIDMKQLWKKRVTQYIKETSRYLKYMFNDHLVIALIFFIGGAAYYYNEWLTTLQNNFPYALIIAAVFTTVLTNSKVTTLLKEPDIVFFLPVEKQFAAYFQKAFLHSLISAAYSLIIVAAGIAPLFFQTTNKSGAVYLLLLCFVILCKVWNLFIGWKMSFFQSRSSILYDYSLRFAINFTLMYFLFSGAGYLFISIIIVIMITLAGYYQKITQSKSIPWEHLIELESRRMMTFYRIANLFTDVPKLKEQVKRRIWLDWIPSFISYSQRNTFAYLYIRTFIRSSDYLGSYLRLTAIGGLILYYVPLYYGKISVLVLFLYLTGYQLITLWRHHYAKIWIKLYPIAEKEKGNSFRKVLFRLLIAQCFILTLFVFVTGNYALAVITLLSGVVFAYLFVTYYVQAKIERLT